MQDKRTMVNAPVLSVPAEPEAPREAPRWTRAIEGDEEAEAFADRFKANVEPWLSMGEKLMNHINYCMLSLGGMKKESPTKASLIERLKPVLALKEVVDIETGRQVTGLLDALQQGKVKENK